MDKNEGRRNEREEDGIHAGVLVFVILPRNSIELLAVFYAA